MTDRKMLRRTLVTIAVLMLISVGCGEQAAKVSPTPSSGIGGSVTAGPTCPVEKVPADPSCAPRHVGAAGLVVRNVSGVEVAHTTTGSDGTFFVALPPGSYVVAPQPVEGLM